MATPARTNGFTRVKQSARSSSISTNGKNGAKPAGRSPVSVSANGNGKITGNGKIPPTAKAAKPEAKILFQKYFHSVGPRTYATQVKELANGNHLLVLTEGKRDPESGELRKTRLLVFGEDLSAFFKLLQETAVFIRANPLSEEVKERRSRFWAKKNKEARASGRPSDEE